MWNRSFARGADLTPGTHIVDSANLPLRQNLKVGRHNIAHVQVVARHVEIAHRQNCGLQVASNRDRLAREPGGRKVRTLTTPGMVERPCDNGLHAMGARPLQAQHLRCDLADGIGVAWRGWVSFGDRQRRVFNRTVNVGAADVQKAA